MALNRVAVSTPKASFWVGQKVWLEAKNLTLPYQTKKLAPRQHGPFVITKQVSPVAYQLDLPLAWAIHDMFHASLLMPYHETTEHGINYSNPPPEVIEGEAEFEVKAVLGHRFFGQGCKLQYLIQWKGYPSADNTWEPKEQVFTPKLLEAYHRKHPLSHPFPHKRTAARTIQGIPSLPPLSSTPIPNCPPLIMCPSPQSWHPTSILMLTPKKNSRSLLRCLRTPSQCHLAPSTSTPPPPSPLSQLSTSFTPSAPMDLPKDSTKWPRTWEKQSLPEPLCTNKPSADWKQKSPNSMPQLPPLLLSPDTSHALTASLTTMDTSPTSPSPMVGDDLWPAMSADPPTTPPSLKELWRGKQRCLLHSPLCYPPPTLL